MPLKGSRKSGRCASPKGPGTDSPSSLALASQANRVEMSSAAPVYCEESAATAEDSSHVLRNLRPGYLVVLPGSCLARPPAGTYARAGPGSDHQKLAAAREELRRVYGPTRVLLLPPPGATAPGIDCGTIAGLR